MRRRSEIEALVYKKHEVRPRGRSSFLSFLHGYLKPHQLAVLNDVLYKDARYYTYLKARQRGGSTVLAALCLLRADVGDVAVYTKDMDAARVVYRRIVAIARKAGISSSYTFRRSPFLIDAPSGNQVFIGTFGGETKPGNSLATLILDEAFAVKQDFWDVITPSTAAQHGAKTILLSTPGYKMGVLWTQWCNSLEAEQAEDGAVAIRRNLHDEFAGSAEYDAMLDPRDLENARLVNSPARVRSEYFCEWIDKTGDVFGDLSRCVCDDFGAISEDVVLSIDPGYGGGLDFTAFCIMGIDTGNVYFASRNNMGGSAEQIRWAVEQVATALDRGLSVQSVCIETNSVGKLFYEALCSSFTSLYRSKRIVATPWTGTGESSKRADIDLLAAALQDGRVTLPDDPEVLDDFISMQRHVSPSGNVQYDAPSGSHDDYVACVAHAWHEVYRCYRNSR